MTPKEMIEVLQAYERGEAIEMGYADDWIRCTAPNWNFFGNNYRVAKPAPKKMQMLGWMDEEGGVKLRSVRNAILPTWKRLPQFDCEVES